ncbi:kinesin-related protein 4-like [Leptopilina boulardi]|uniref:kinesin-related protein 4-like n=1 Tax=Leptopilina boulardi TaxID=63433 RepID=UPI0021F506B3|nr:kinesin-related protein 4-like [Leptopilina boulardi]XP_051168494.1 kinesin-related protein 4-like [Leptopilina boulardi]
MLSRKGLNYHDDDDDDDDDDADSGVPSSPFSITQADFLEYLQLGLTKKQIRIRSCSVMILGSKCSICKREFKCVTDTRKHMKKKHKYLKRKSDDKLVRIKLKMGKETFCDNTISKKFLLTPERGSKSIPAVSSSDSQPLQVSYTHCPPVKPSKSVNQNLLAKLSVPLSVALCDINSLDQNAKFKNGRVYKERNTDSTSLTASSDSIPDNALIIEDCDSDATWDLNSGSASDSENTVVYVSDVEVDLSEFYEDVKPPKNLDSDIEDAETVVMPNDAGDDTLDNKLADLDDITPEDLEALGKTCEDMDMADIYTEFGMTDGFVNLEDFCQSLERIETNPNVVEKDLENNQRSLINQEESSRKRRHETEMIQTDVSQAKTVRKSSELEISQSDQKEREASRKSGTKKTENVIKLVNEVAEILKEISEAECGRKNTKKIETSQRYSKGTENDESNRRCSKDAENSRRDSKESETIRRRSKNTGTKRKSSRDADTNRKNLKDTAITHNESKDARTTRKDSKEDETTRRHLQEGKPTRKSSKDKKIVGIKLKKLKTTQQYSPPIQDNLWQAETISTPSENSEMISNQLANIEVLLNYPRIVETFSQSVNNNSETNQQILMEKNQDLNLHDHSEISDDDLDGMRIGCRSFEDLEKVKQRLEAGDNNFIDITELDNVNDCLESSEVTFSLAIENVGNKMKEDEDVIIIDDDDDDDDENNDAGHSQPQLEEFLRAAVLKYIQKCNANSSSLCEPNNNKNNNNLKNGITNQKNSSKLNYHLKKALMKLGITITSPPSLIKEENN